MQEAWRSTNFSDLFRKIRIFANILTGNTKPFPPVYVNIDLSSRCNMNCIDCQYHSPFSKRHYSNNESIQDIPIPLARKLFVELKSMGVNSLSFSGEGEPLLHPDITDIISLSKREGFYTTLNTNGTLLNEKIIGALIKNRFNKIKVGIWTFPKNASNPFTDKQEKVFEALKKLSAEKKTHHSNTPQAVLHCIITRRNYSELDAIVKMALQLNCDEVSFSPLWYWRDKGEITALSSLETSQVLTKLTSIKKKLKKLTIKHNIDEVIFRYRLGELVWENLPCYVPWFTARIRVNGMIFPCHRSTLSMGTLQEKSFSDIWNSAAFRSFRKTVMTRNGLKSFLRFNDCRFCCFTKDNYRIYKYLSRTAALPFQKNRFTNLLRF